MTDRHSTPTDSDPYRPPADLPEAPPGPRGRCSSLAGSCLGALVGGTLGLVGGWALLIGPNPGPGFHITFPFILGAGALLALVGGASGYLLLRRLRGGPQRAAPWFLAGATLAGGGLIFLWLSHVAGPFLTGAMVSKRLPDGSHSYSTRHYDREVGALSTLAGLGLLLAGWARRREGKRGE